MMVVMGEMMMREAEVMTIRLMGSWAIWRGSDGLWSLREIC